MSHINPLTPRGVFYIGGKLSGVVPYDIQIWGDYRESLGGGSEVYRSWV